MRKVAVCYLIAVFGFNAIIQYVMYVLAVRVEMEDGYLPSMIALLTRFWWWSGAVAVVAGVGVVVCVKRRVRESIMMHSVIVLLFLDCVMVLCELCALMGLMGPPR